MKLVAKYIFLCLRVESVEPIKSELDLDLYFSDLWIEVRERNISNRCREICIEMNNGDIGGPRGRGRGWQQPDNQPRELRRPKIVAEESATEESKGKIKTTNLMNTTLSHTELVPCDVVILGQFITAFFVIIILQVKVRIFISNDVAVV